MFSVRWFPLRYTSSIILRTQRVQSVSPSIPCTIHSQSNIHLHLPIRHFSSNIPPANVVIPASAAQVASRLSDSSQFDFLSSTPQSQIRNFGIIAHIDHGKSTLADRLLELAGNIDPLAKHEAQVLDNLQVERERGITVKAQTASMFYRHQDGQEYLLNLIDTPGHVDFSYEVSRSLAACQGALLIVDASQGIQAQTLANYWTAKEAGLDIIPVLTKMDLPHADPKSVAEQLKQALDIDESEIIHVSSKSGQGVESIYPAVIERIRAPSGADSADSPLRALLFDSWFDQHRGVICLISIKSGEIRKGDRIATYHLNHQYEVQDLGILMPRPKSTESLKCGQVGFLIAGMKSSKEARLGDTFYRLGTRKQLKNPVGTQAMQTIRETIEPLPGFKPSKSFVFAGLFPAQSSDFELLTAAIEKLTLNDASVHIEKESSVALGLGFRCGFLGVLHMDVFSSRLEQEFGASVIITAPTVPFQGHLKGGKIIRIDSPAKFPHSNDVVSFSEPMVRASIIAPAEYLGAMLELCNSHRGTMEDVTHIGTTRVHLRYRLPLAEIVVDFYDQVKSLTSGYASFDYEEAGYQPADLVKLDIKLNGESVDALSFICISASAEPLGRKIVKKLKEKIDRAQFEIVIQAAVGTKVLARERLAPFRKDVLVKSGKLVGGGDETRKKKLLEKQKEGKKRMKAVGNVELNEDVFTSIMKIK